MLKIFWAFIKKETFHILRDRRTLLILFGMPIVLVLLFGYAVTNEFKDSSFAVLNQSKNDALSQQLIHHLQASGHFKLVRDLASYEDLEQAMKLGTIKLGVIIPPNFESDFFRNKQTDIQLIADGTEPNYATTLVTYATQMIRQFQKNHNQAASYPYQIDVQAQMVYNPELISAYNFIPGVVALILLLISAMMTSLTIAKEKELGTMDLLLVSPLPPLLIILGKVTPYIFLSFMDAVIVLIMGYYIFEVPILGSLPLLLGACLLYLSTSLALGLVISTKAATQQVAMMSSLFSLMMPTMLLSGFIFPIDSMPLLLQYISTIVPATYFIEVLKGLMLKGVGWQLIWFPILILSMMTLVLLLAAWKNFKIREK
jgi:ABC-2 type transport system permease protein